MKDRFVAYGIFLLLFYIAFFMWRQSKNIEILNTDLEFQRDIILKQKVLISSQNEYIEVLEAINAQNLSPLHIQPKKYKLPI